MELVEIDGVVIPYKRLCASQTIDLADNQKLMIKTTGPAIDLLDVNVPSGKKWTANVSVTITETDA